MAADQLHRYLTAALVGNIDELGAGGFLESDGEDLVFLLGAGATHLETLLRFARHGFCRRDEFLRGFMGRLGIHPQHELIQRQH